jgi:hypothetical protein
MPASPFARRGTAIGLAFVATAFILGWSARPRTPLGRGGSAAPAPAQRGMDLEIFEALRKPYQDLEYEGLVERIGPSQKTLEKISFDPTQAKYFELVRERLGLTEHEAGMVRQNGFVAVDPGMTLTFGTAYHQLYVRDLPVLVTTDSILHAVHRSYDRILMELEAEWFAPTIGEILAACHSALAGEDRGLVLPEDARDVDLYLTVARNLLAGAGATSSGPEPPQHDFLSGRPVREEWSGQLLVHSAFGQDGKAQQILDDIRSLLMQTPDGPMTEIYGGRRCVDYSQFKPRGHYGDSVELRRYFRCMMWLGRADCALYVLPFEQSEALQVDTDRELRAAVRLTRLLESTGQIEALKAIHSVLAFMVGRSDDLSPSPMLSVLRTRQIGSTGAADLTRLKQALHAERLGRQMIRSQVLAPSSAPAVQAEIPAAFQMLGQRFGLDSFLLTRFVHDAIDYHGQKMQRYMPTGLDLMAALGSNEAVPLLEAEIRRWGYAANLMAARDFVAGRPPESWSEDVYHGWLDALRALDDPLPESACVPEAMRTRSWQRKQLQTQLGSWAELRHDTLLYAKQSYAVPGCEYPSGYVEPYPSFFARVRQLAEDAGRRLAGLLPPSRDPEIARAFLQKNEARQQFFANMARTAGRLEVMAQAELDGREFTAEEIDLLRKTIDRRGTGSGPARFDGWYSNLFYSPFDHDQWRATVADVHTDPTFCQALQVATGNTSLLVVAVDDSQGDRAVYVGPAYSYYEFHQPVGDRLTDAQWMQRVRSRQLPERPEWARSFHAPPREDGPGLPHHEPSSR